MTSKSPFSEACERGDIIAATNLLPQLDLSLGEIAAKLRESDLINKKEKAADIGQKELHYHLELMKQLVELDDLCDDANKEGETPLKLAISLGFKEAVEYLVTRIPNALHYIVELNQVKLVEYLNRRKVNLSEIINQGYKEQSPTNSADKGNCATNPSENDGIRESGDGGDKPSQSAARNKNKAEEEKSTNSTETDKQPIIVIGDTPLHIAARNKYEDMVNLLLKVDKVDKHIRNSENKTPFLIAREVTEYYESFRTIRKLGDFKERSKSFMYCAPQVSHKKYKNARSMIDKAYEERRNAELVVAALLAAMTCAAAFTVPGGFVSENNGKKKLGSPILIHFPSFKLFLIFDCIAFFLSLFVCIMWEMSCELTTGHKMVFMTVNSLVVCFSFGFTAYAFMCAVYTMLATIKDFSRVVLGSLIFIALCGVLAFIQQSVQFSVKRARFHRLCGASLLFDNIVEKLWSGAECCGLLNLIRSGERIFHDCITGHFKFSTPKKYRPSYPNNSHLSVNDV